MQDITNENQKTLMTTLGEIIKEYRKARSKTIYRISAESAVPKATWREVELGACNDINFTTIWKIAEGLEVEPAKLIDELSKRLNDKFSLVDND